MRCDARVSINLLYSTFGLLCWHQACVLNPIIPNSQPSTNSHGLQQEYGRVLADYQSPRIKSCMDNAELLHCQQEDLLPDDFWQQIGLSSPSHDGLVHETTRAQHFSVGKAFLRRGQLPWIFAGNV